MTVEQECQQVRDSTGSAIHYDTSQTIISSRTKTEVTQAENEIPVDEVRNRVDCPVHVTEGKYKHIKNTSDSNVIDIKDNHPVSELDHLSIADVNTASNDASDGTIRYWDMPNWMPDLEDVQRYNQGGYHPVDLGDTLDGRYEVVHKLGSGGFGIVWLCHDTVTKGWRALKIMTAEDSTTTSEPKIYAHLLSQAPLQEILENHITMPLAQFWIEGPNGKHLCLVLPVVGGPVDSWNSSRPYRTDKDLVSQQLNLTKPICRQITRSLNFLHKHGVCHGDVKPDNILMKLASIDGHSKDEILQILGEPVCVEVERESGEGPNPRAPKYIVRPPQHRWWKTIASDEVALIDFGTSFLTAEEHEPAMMTRLYAAPEYHFHGCVAPGPYSDVWSLACTMLKVSAGDFPPFASLDESLEYLPRDLELFVGPLLEPFRSHWWAMLDRAGLEEVDDASQSDEEDSTQHSQDQPPQAMELEPVSYTVQQFRRYKKSKIGKSGYSTPMEALIGRNRSRDVEEKGNQEKSHRINFHYPRQDVRQFVDFLKTMFKYNPQRRATTDEILQHLWLEEPVRPPTKSQTALTIPYLPLVAVSISVALAGVLCWLFNATWVSSESIDKRFVPLSSPGQCYCAIQGT
ncbi:kinase-like protein [Xylariaceae sp. FL1019]|nr:kinase-like protein [Xylariaceae sp. FL1019]